MMFSYSYIKEIKMSPSESDFLSETVATNIFIYKYIAVMKRNSLLFVLVLFFVCGSVLYSQNTEAEEKIVELINKYNTGEQESVIPELEIFLLEDGLVDCYYPFIACKIHEYYYQNDSNAFNCNKVNSFVDKYLHSGNCFKYSELLEVDYTIFVTAQFFNGESGNYSKQLEYLDVLESGYKTITNNKEDVYYLDILSSIVTASYFANMPEKGINYGEKALELSKTVLSTENEGSVYLYYNLAHNYVLTGDTMKARTCLQSSINVAEEVLGNKKNDLIDFFLLMEESYSELNFIPELILISEKITQAKKEVYGRSSSEYLSSLDNLISLNYNNERYDKTEELYLEAIEVSKKNHVYNKSYYPTYVKDLGDFYFYDTQDYESAKKLYKEYLSFVRKNFGGESIQYTDGLDGIGASYIGLRKYKEAIFVYNEVLNVNEKRDGLKSIEYSQTLNLLAWLYEQTEDYNEALSLYNEVLDIIGHNKGIESVDYAQVLQSIGSMYYLTKQYSKAISSYKNAIQIFRNTNNKHLKDYSQSLFFLASIYKYNTRTQSLKAQAIYQELSEIYKTNIEKIKNTLGVENWDYIENLRKLADVNYNLGIFQKAIINYQESLLLIEKLEGKTNLTYLQDLSALILCYDKSNNVEKVTNLYNQSIELTEKIYGKNSLRYIEEIDQYSSFLSKIGLYVEATELRHTALEIAKKLNGRYDDKYLYFLNALALQYDQAANYENAIIYYNEASEITKELSGENSIQYALALKKLLSPYGIAGRTEDKQVLRTKINLILDKLPIDNYQINSHDDNIYFNDIAQLYESVEKYESAISIYKKQLSAIEDWYGKYSFEYYIKMRSLAFCYSNAEMYNDAESIHKELINITETIYGEESITYAQVLYGFGSFYFHKLEKHNEAIELFKKSAQIGLKVQGEHGDDYKKFLNMIAYVYKVTNEIKNAEDIYLRLIEISSKRDTVSTSYAKVLSDLGHLYFSADLDQKAIPIFQRSLNIYKKTEGINSYQYIDNLAYLAYSYRNTNDYNLTIKTLNRVVDLSKKTQGENSIKYINYLEQVASTYYTVGEYDKALIHYKDLLSMTDIVYGNESDQSIQALGNIALVYSELGIYDKAINIYNDILKLTLRVKGKQNKEYLICLTNIANTYKLVGKYNKAIENYEYALDAYDSIANNLTSIFTGKGDLGVMQAKKLLIYQDLVEIYRNIGQYEKSKCYYDILLKAVAQEYGQKSSEYLMYLSSMRSGNTSLKLLSFNEYEIVLEIRNALAIKGDTLNQGYAISSIALANFHKIVGDQNEVHKFIEEAINIEESIQNLDPTTMDIKSYITVLLTSIRILNFDFNNDFKTILKTHLRTLKLAEEFLGDDHPYYATLLEGLASSYGTFGKYDKAIEYGRQAKIIKKTALSDNYYELINIINDLGDYYEYNSQSNFSLNERIEAVNVLKNNIFQNFTYLSENEKSKFLSTVNYNFDLFNSFVLRHLNLNDSIPNFVYDNTLLNKGILLKSSLAMRNSIINSNDTILINKYNNWILLKKEIARIRSKGDNNNKTKNLDIAEMKASEIEGELVRSSTSVSDYKKLQEVDIDDIKEKLNSNEAAIEFFHFDYYNKGWTDSTLYCALVLKKDFKTPKLIYLFEEEQINGVVSTSKDINVRLHISELYSNDTLYNLVWQPLDSLLQGVENIYYSPSGLLHKISFSAISDNKGELLSDRYSLSLMSTTANLTLNQEHILNNTAAAVYGGITYDLTFKQMTTEASAYHPKGDLTLKSPTRSWVFDDTLRGRNWSFLEGTLIEAKEITSTLKHNKLNVTNYNGPEANEESFKSLSGKQSPEIIHIATHGFFFPNPKKQKPQKQNRFKSINEENIYSIASNPLMRSGLLFAGANVKWRGEKIPENIEDGTLTAYEASNLDLFNTKLITLSACETGLGDIKGAEGVYGLQRAFKMAGVKYLIMSLWQIPDKETQEFMNEFYKNLVKYQIVEKAFLNTQKVMKQKYDTFYWAGFVLLN